jgi:hypothetical protein
LEGKNKIKKKYLLASEIKATKASQKINKRLFIGKKKKKNIY